MDIRGEMEKKAIGESHCHNTCSPPILEMLPILSSFTDILSRTTHPMPPCELIGHLCMHKLSHTKALSNHPQPKQ